MTRKHDESVEFGEKLTYWLAKLSTVRPSHAHKKVVNKFNTAVALIAKQIDAGAQYTQSI